MDSCNNGPKVPYDPGWNDPPVLSYNAQQTTTNRPRNFLNKRVAFPLSGNNAGPGAGSLPPVSLPPMPSAPPVSAAPILPPQEEITIDSNSTLAEVKSILLKLLEESQELGPKANGIKRRIGTMEEMWSDGKLNNKVHLLMKELACALRDNEPNKADDLHRTLMVDHVSAVGTWMPGVKQLIHYCIAKSELLSVDKE